MITRYLWRRSPYDSQVHAFPADQARDDTLDEYYAACTHTAPVGQLRHERGGDICTACLIRVGSQLPQASLVPAI